MTPTATPTPTPTEHDVLRYAFGQGPGRDFVSPLGPPERPLTTSFGTLPTPVRTNASCRLVWGTVDLLDDARFPEARPHAKTVALPVAQRLQHALVATFGLQRREPSNLFNDHRSCASVRSRFPVQAFVSSGSEAWYLDVYRHGLLPVGDAHPALPAGEPLRVALAGRYTHLPSLYGRLRGPLAELELGISLRGLWTALELFGLSGDLELPGAGAGASMAHLGLEPTSEWTVPLLIDVAGASENRSAPGRATDEADAKADRALERIVPSKGDDPTLAEVVAVNRTSLEAAVIQDFGRRHGGTASIPLALAPSRLSWAEVLWRRTAGHMPRQLAGFSGRRRPLDGAAVDDALHWLRAAPPTPLLAEIAGRIKVSVCLQDAPGHKTGWYRAAAGRELHPVFVDPALPARLEACYGHGLASTVGCAVRHASMTWLLSVDVPSLVADFGPGGWTLAQYATGWMAHGLALSAAAHGLYARPTRAFDEVLLHPVVGSEPGEIVLLSVVCGAGRFVEPVLDLRT